MTRRAQQLYLLHTCTARGDVESALKVMAIMRNDDQLNAALAHVKRHIAAIASRMETAS